MRLDSWIILLVLSLVNQATPVSHMIDFTWLKETVKLAEFLWWKIPGTITAIIYTFTFIQKYERQELGSLLRSD